MNRELLAAEASRLTGMSKCQVRVAMAGILHAISLALCRGETVELRGVGVLEIKVRGARIGRDLQHGGKAPIPLPPRARVIFRPSAPLEAAVAKLLPPPCSTS